MDGGAEQGLGGGLDGGGGFFAGVASDVDEPDQRFDAGGGPDGDREPGDVYVRVAFFEWCQGFGDPADGAALAQHGLVGGRFQGQA
ncbi:hypothetical protein ACFQ1L_16080 [Phytohabitans flavus]|uniref:hypothetical protein n=1 Tax=Phytohabitans flavus TaxID=1076124 RepID=UPI003633C7D8